MKNLITLLALSALTASAFANTEVAGDEKQPVWDANIVVLTSEKLGDGVYAYYPTEAKQKEAKGLPVATSGGFVVGENGVLMIDTMLNKRLNGQAQALLKEVSNAPLNFAVNTSAHGDHSYGNMYLPSTTQIIQHVNTKYYVDNSFEHDTQFMISNFGEGRGIEEIVPTTGDILIPAGGSLTIDLGKKQVQIIDFGFAQTGGDLFVWEPESKVLWTGNAFITVQPALPWLLDGHLVETLDTFHAVNTFLPEGARIVPGHGSVMSKADLQWHIDYLTAVKTEVAAAIEEGLTLEQTVKRVTLPAFQGYALFGWVHPSLNVPAAYKDLSK